MHRSAQEIEAGLGDVSASPADNGVLCLVVCRPSEGEREVLERGELDVEQGLVGDRWAIDAADPERQLTLMNWRAVTLVSPDESRTARSPATSSTSTST